MKNITFINAGAGSGKTYRLTEILVENIKNGVCQGDEVILTTFTDSAAKEFKTKAREALLKAGLYEQANLLPSAAIGTVHSVAYQMIQKYWHYIDSGVELDLITEEDEQFFLNQALANIPTSEELEDLGSLAIELNFIGEYQTINFDQWKFDLNRVVELALNNNMNNLEACKDDSIREVLRVFQPIEFTIDPTKVMQMLNRLEEAVQMAADNNANQTRLQRIREFQQLTTWKVKDYMDLVKFLSPPFPKGIYNKIEGLDVFHQNCSLAYRSSSFVDKITRYVALVFELAQKSINEYQQYKKENRLIDYNDMELLFLELLQIDEVASEIRNRYKRILVDEFQDSSPIQVQIFNRLSEILEHSYWVGDPKQAIYGFRGTDPAMIAAVLHEFKDGKKRNLDIDNLDYSWRSRPEIVSLTNNVFTPALEDQVHDADKIALKSVRTNESLPEQHQFHATQHWHFDNDSRPNKNYFNHHLVSELKEIIESGQYMVVDKEKSQYHLDGENNNVVTRKIRPGDIAVLCRTNNNISGLASAFKEAGMEVAAGRKGLNETAEMKLFMACLNYLQDVNDNLAKTELLLLSGVFTSTENLIDQRLVLTKDKPKEVDFDLSEQYEKAKKAYYETLSQWQQDQPILKRLDHLREKAKHLSVPEIAALVSQEAGLYDLVKSWNDPGTRIKNLHYLVKLASNYDEHCINLNLGASLNGFAEYLNQLSDKSLMQQADVGDSAINLTTYHRSKGLEWPLVVLTDLSEDHLSDKKLVNRNWFGVSLCTEGHIDISDPFKGKKIVLIPWIFGRINSTIPEDLTNRIKGATGEATRFRLMETEERKEVNRLLYVGMTRARDMLITTSFKNQELHWLNVALPDAQAKARIEALDNNPAMSDVFNVEQAVYVKKCHYEAPFDFPDFTRMAPYTYQKRNPIEQNNPRFRNPSHEIGTLEANVNLVHDFGQRIPLSGDMKGRENELGDCLHDIFYLYDTNIDGEVYVEKLTRIISNHQLQGILTDPTAVMMTIARLHVHLAETFGAPLNVYKELSMQVPGDGYVYRGEADLVWEVDDGIVLVDYKSYPGSKKDVLATNHEKYAGNYAGQLVRYKEMIEATHPKKKKVIDMLIFYSVMGALVKLEV